MDSGKSAGLAEFYVESQVELHPLEKPQAAHSEIGFEIGDVAAPSRRAYLPGVDAGRFARDFAALYDGDVSSAPRQAERRRRPRDSAADYERVGFVHARAARPRRSVKARSRCPSPVVT